MELDNSLVIFSFGHLRSFDEERDPIVTAVTVEVGSMEVISVNEVTSFLINIDNNVDLVSGVNVLFFNTFVGQSDESSFLVEGSISSIDLVVSQPSEVVKHELMGFLEGMELLEVLNFLPFLVRCSLVEHLLVNLQKGSFLNVTVVVSLVVLFQQERFKVDDQFHFVIAFSSNSSVFDDPVFIKETEFFFEKLFDLREGGMILEFFNEIFCILGAISRVDNVKNWSSLSKVVSLFSVLINFGVFTVLEFTIDVFEVESISVKARDRFAVTSNQGSAFNLVKVSPDDIVETNRDPGVLLGPFDTYSHVAIFFIIT